MALSDTVYPTRLSWLGTNNNNFFNMPRGYYDTQANIATTAKYGMPDFSSTYGRMQALGNVDNAINEFEVNQGLDSGNKMNWGGIMQAAGGAAAVAAPRGMWDKADPVYYLAGGRHSTIGNGLSDMGVSLFKSGAASGNPWIMLAGGAAKVAGGLYNTMFGYNIKNEQAVRDNITKLANVKFNARDMDTLASQFSSGGLTKVGLGSVKNGLFNSTGTKKANELSTLQNNLYDFGMRSFGNALGNIGQETKGNFMRNYFDLGGPLYTMNNTDSAIGYDLASRYLITKEKEAQNKGKLAGLSPLASINNNFALGGDVQTHGGDFTTGISRIDSGGVHEANPNEGVQIGVDPEGNPNLVEEGEVIYNDFVYSNRIELDEEAKEAFHFPRKKKLTYAEAAKKLEKEASERPNDPISKAALERQMEDLAQHQERQKQEMQAERAQEEFASLSPEEQIAVMQQLQQGQEGMVSPEEQAAQEQAMQQQAMQEQAMAQQGMGMQPQGIIQGGSPEEAMAMQQMMGGEQPVPQMAYGGNIYAYGGNVNKFDFGGALEWVRQNHPEFNEIEQEELAKFIDQEVGSNSRLTYDAIWKRYYPILRNEDNITTYFNKLVKRGVSPEVAFRWVYPDAKTYVSRGGIEDRSAFKRRNKLYNKLLNKSDVKPKAWKDLEGNKYKTEKEAINANYAIKDRANAGDEAAAMLLGDLYAKGNETTKKNINKALQYYQIAASKGNADAINKHQALTASMVDSGNNTTNAEAVNLYNPKSYTSTTANTSAPASASVSAPKRRNGSGLYSYSGYNGPMGTNAPLGFTVDSNGNVTNYSDEYRNYVNNVLTANALRDYINSADNLASTDSSYASYLNSGNVLNNLTDAQLRSGALDSNYGFLHNMANALYEDYIRKNPNADLSNPASASLGLSNNIDDTLIGKSPLQSTADNAGALSYWDWNQGKYVKRPVATKPKETTSATAKAKTGGEDSKDKFDLGEIEPILSERNAKQYFKPILPGAIGLIGQVALGRQNYEGLENAANIAATPHLISSKSVGTPIIPDIQSPAYIENPIIAASNGLDRALVNSANPSRDANRIANLNNTMRSLGEAALQMNKYNDTERSNAIKYNNELARADEAERYAAEAANAGILNAHDQYLSNAKMAIERGKLEDEVSWNNNLFANMSKISQGILDRDRELDTRDMVARLVAAGVLGNISPENAMNAGWIRYKKPVQSKNGGKIKRNKRRGGLTF